MGFSFVFKAFAIIIIGGLGNVAGAAIAEVGARVCSRASLGGSFRWSWFDALAFTSMIAILLLRPAGSLGRGGPRMTAGWLRAVAVVLGVAALFAIPRVTGNE